MPTLRVAYKRTFQIKPYESQTIEFSVEDEEVLDSKKLGSRLAEMARAYGQMEAVGEELMVVAMGGGGNGKSQESLPEPPASSLPKAPLPPPRRK